MIDNVTPDVHVTDVLTIAPIIVGMLLLGGCAGGDMLYSGYQDDIPDGANRIILTQQPLRPAEMYLNALNYFDRHNWETHVSEGTEDLDDLDAIYSQENEPLAFSVRREINEQMALQISVHVQSVGEQAQLIASADYADAIPAEEWHDAAWTDGSSRRAFFEAFEALRGTAYDDARFEVGVAVEPGA